MIDLRLKVLPILLVYIFLVANQVKCDCGETIPHFGPNLIATPMTEGNYLTVENLIDEEVDIKTGDVMECEITKMEKVKSSKTNTHVFTQGSQTQYVFSPVSKDKKCFSVEIRTRVLPHLLLSATPVTQGQMCHLILEHSGRSIMRTNDNKEVSAITMQGIVNEREFSGFWLRWLDNHLLEFGRNTDNYPLLSYRFPDQLSPNFIGIFSYTANAEWIIHKEPKCGPYNVTEKTLTETKCKTVTKRNLQQNNILEKSQTHILNLIKKQHEIFKTSKFRSKELLLEYQQLIRKYFRNAEEHQIKINAADNEIYCPLKAKTFHEINEEYFQFLEELQMELSLFKEQTPTSSENLITHCSGCCGCSNAPKLF